MIQKVLLHDFGYCKQKSQNTYNHLIPYSLCFIAIWCFLKNVLDIQSFFSILACHINDIDNDLRSFSFDAAHDDHYNLNCRIYYVLRKFTDIMCICLDLFLCSYQYMYPTKYTKIIK